jgi:hypothetical protein
MTEPIAGTAAPAQKASFFEDLIDIFFQPADVYRRRETGSYWPALLTVTLLLAVFTFANANVLQPIFDAEWSRQAALAAKRGGGQAAIDAMNKMRPMIETGQKFGAVVFVPVFIFVLGLVTWLVGKLFGAKQTYHAAVMVVSYAFMVRVIEAVLNGIQGLLMDPASLTALTKIQMSPARFLDTESTNPLLLALLGRVDLFTIWLTVLLAVGMYVTGKISRGRAAAFGVTMWILGSLPALRNGYMAM